MPPHACVLPQDLIQKPVMSKHKKTSCTTWMLRLTWWKARWRGRHRHVGLSGFVGTSTPLQCLKRTIWSSFINMFKPSVFWFFCAVYPRMQLFENARLIAGRWQHWTFRGFRQAYTCVITFWWREKSKNPPAPKVPRRQRRVSLAASDTGRAGRGGHFRQSRPPKSARDCRLSRFAQFADRLKIIQLHRFDPTWPQHWLDLGSTSASKAPTSAQLGSKMAQLGSKTAQLGPKFDLFGSNFGPSWRPHYGFKMGGWAK